MQKVLAAAGIASRRECEALILAGRVEVDRETVTVLGTRVDPLRQEIRVDGTPLAQPRHVYYLVNKPTGVVSTNRDPDGRPRVIDLVPSETRLFAIGRLDRSSEGMILLTNDGELANQLTHPRFGISKTYRAKVLGHPSPETIQKLRKGIHLSDGLAQVAGLRIKGRHARGSELEIVLTEGRNREIRRILARVGHKVLHLRRIAIGSIRLGRLPAGQWRRLTREEVKQLRASVARSTRRGATDGRTGEAPQARRDSDTATRSKGVSKTGRAKKSATGARTRTTPGGKKKTTSRKWAKKPAIPRTGAVLDYDGSASEGSTERPKKSKKSSAKGKRRK